MTLPGLFKNQINHNLRKMEAPDCNGFVNVTWPSKSVPHGGIFHTRVVNPSSAQQGFLKVLLEESKLTLAQRRKTALQLREEKSGETPKTSKAPPIRPRTSRRRSLSAIRESGALDVDHYRPLKRGEDRDKLKEKFANTMTYGDVEQKPPTPPTIPATAPNLPTKNEQWNNLVTQIRERAEWLAEMEDLGHAGPHRELIKDQIAERLRALDVLGVDTQCSSARSSASGFSILPSERSVCSDKSAKKSAISNEMPITKRSQVNKKIESKQKHEEHVGDYMKFSPLQYSPRRRV